MPSPWSLPKSVTQYADSLDHIPWDSSGDFVYLKNNDREFTKTLDTLKHRANLRVGPIKNKTWYLIATNFFFFIPRNVEKIIGIQVQIKADRGGRIIDDTVQLRYNDQWIGENRAQFTVAPKFTYGSGGRWNINYADTTATFTMVGAQSFGVGIRMQSHPNYPHESTPMIDYIAMRLLFNGDENIPGDDGPSLLQGDEFSDPNLGLGGPDQGARSDQTGGEGEPNYVDWYDPRYTGPDVFRGSQGAGFIGSFGFAGSQGFIGSTGPYTGSTGFTGSNLFPQFGNAIVSGNTLALSIGPGSFIVNEIINIPNINARPQQGLAIGNAYRVIGENVVYYWIGIWASVNV